MKILVLGGCGIQGRTAVFDLTRSKEVSQIICADARPEHLDLIKPFTDLSRVSKVRLTLDSPDDVTDLLKNADAAINLLPRHYDQMVCRAAIDAGTSIVHTNYDYGMSDLDEPARSAGVAIMPECGLDPGIDLVIYGKAVDTFDELHVINSYCGGIPEKAACDNPLNYKVSWTWEGVLMSTKRDSRMIKNGSVFEIPAARQHDPEFVHTIEFPGLGQLEAIPNGNAVFFTDLLGLSDTIRETGRYSLRWPGWSAFWRPLKQLGFLDEHPIAGLSAEITPFQVLDKLIGPQIQYRDNEKDLVAMVNVFEGKIGDRRVRQTSRILIERDLENGLMAMSKGVGCTASIVAQMIARGDIAEKGVLSPARHIPVQSFLRHLMERGISIEESETFL